MWDFPRFTSNIFGRDGLGATSGGNTDTFQRQYVCYPVSFVGKEELEKGNKILLPQSALNVLARMNVTWPMLFKLANSTLDRSTHCGVLEFSADEGTCYMPYWMMKNLILSEGSLVEVSNTTLPKGTYVKLQSVTMDFLEISDHRAVLEHALRHFAALTKGDHILIQHNDRSFELEVLDSKPSDAISIIETDMQVDFAAPKDYIEPPPRRPGEQSSDTPSVVTPCSAEPTSVEDVPLAVSKEKGFVKFGGSGMRLDGRLLGPPSPANTPDDLRTSSISSPDVTMQAPRSDCGGSVGETEPWRNALTGGVRTVCRKYTEMVREGRVPGMQHSLRNKPSEPPPTQLFQGEGHTL